MGYQGWQIGDAIANVIPVRKCATVMHTYLRSSHNIAFSKPASHPSQHASRQSDLALCSTEMYKFRNQLDPQLKQGFPLPPVTSDIGTSLHG